MGNFFCLRVFLGCKRFSLDFFEAGGCVYSQQILLFFTLRLPWAPAFFFWWPSNAITWCALLLQLFFSNSCLLVNLLRLSLRFLCLGWLWLRLWADLASKANLLLCQNISCSSCSSISFQLDQLSLPKSISFSLFSFSLMISSTSPFISSSLKNSTHEPLLPKPTDLRMLCALRLNEGRDFRDLIALLYKPGEQYSFKQVETYSAKPLTTILPARSKACLSKAAQTSLPSLQRPLETSKVQVIGMCQWKSMCARAVYFLYSLILQTHFLQSNMQSCFYKILLNNLERQKWKLPYLCSGPQQNRSFFDEWLWKSKKNYTFLCWDFNFLTRLVSPLISGYKNLPSSLNLRLRSLPLKLVLQLPATTPSGLIMGTTQKLQQANNLAATWVSSSRVRMTPYNMWEELVQPGCILAAMMMLVLAVGCCFEIWSRGRSKPLKDQQREATVTRGLVLSESTKDCRQEQVQGMEQAKQTSISSYLKSYLNCRWLVTRVPPQRHSRSTNATSKHRFWRHQAWRVCWSPVKSQQEQGVMPWPQRLRCLTMLGMLNWMGPVCFLLLTRKQYQLVCPLVLVSLRMKQSYSFFFIRMARSRLPLQNSELNATSLFLQSTSGFCGNSSS